MEKKEVGKTRSQTFSVRGIHCASCVLLIEKKLLARHGVRAVKVFPTRKELKIESRGGGLNVAGLNRLFKKDGYVFGIKRVENNSRFRFRESVRVGAIAILFILAFLGLKKTGLAAFLSLNTRSGWLAFFAFGLLAGFSSCSALVGGIILAMSGQWQKLYSAQDSVWSRFRPHLLFNAGRLVGYALLGALLGIIGQTLRFSAGLSAWMTIGVSVLMVFLALQMLGVRGIGFQIRWPKKWTRFAAEEKNFQGRRMPFVMGALTFFLPCGFTMTAQSLALLTGNPVQAGLLMFFFALGTLPALLLIGLASVRSGARSMFSGRFLKVAGILVLFFAGYNLNSQLNVLGLKSLNDFSWARAEVAALATDLPPIRAGQQILKTDAFADHYEPEILRVRANIPVRWEITDRGTSGCTNAIISKNLFTGQIDLVPGQTSVKEFTSTTPGRYKFSCWMGMVAGVIEVVDENGENGGYDETQDSGEEVLSSCGREACSFNLTEAEE